jgi:hypothetical protein
MNVACIQTQIERSIDDFNGSTTSVCLWLFLEAILNKNPSTNRKITKIVAFGTGSLGCARDENWEYTNGSILAAQTQHAALRSIRHKLEIIYYGDDEKNDGRKKKPKIDVYLQDLLGPLIHRRG